MPIYNYRCTICLVDEEVMLPMSERNNTQVHSCGSVMQRLMSLPSSPVIKHTAKDMALASINDRNSLPDNPLYKAKAQQAIMQGLNDSPKVFY